MLNVGTRWLFLILYIPFTVNVLFTSLSLKHPPPAPQILTPNFSFLFDDRRTSKSTGVYGENKAAVGVQRVDIEAIKSLSFNENDVLFSRGLLAVEYSLT